MERPVESARWPGLGPHSDVRASDTGGIRVPLHSLQQFRALCCGCSERGPRLGRLRTRSGVKACGRPAASSPPSRLAGAERSLLCLPRHSTVSLAAFSRPPALPVHLQLRTCALLCGTSAYAAVEIPVNFSGQCGVSREGRAGGSWQSQLRIVAYSPERGGKVQDSLVQSGGRVPGSVCQRVCSQVGQAQAMHEGMRRSVGAAVVDLWCTLSRCYTPRMNGMT